MIINDDYIINYFINKSNKINHNKLKNIPNDIYLYLINRYNDSLSLDETIKRILWNINKRPICPICGNPVKWYGRKNKPYLTTCSLTCSAKLTSLNQEEGYMVQRQLKGVKTRKLKDNYQNVEKFKSTCNLKYGGNAPSCSQIIKDKIKQTCLKKYGSEYYLTSNDCKEKTIQKFGVDNYRKTKECKDKISNYIKTHKDDINKKRINTFISKYGVTNAMQIKSVKQYFKDNNVLFKQKEYITKKKNKSFNKSELEDKTYYILKEKYPDVIRQYRSEVYPFNCDFYIPSKDLYIECNYHWTHGGKPYEGTKMDLEKLNIWKSKNTDYYNEAIKTWTIRDVYKRKIAQENNLNYVELFDSQNTIL